MTSGSVLTHLTVISSGALVDELEEPVALAGVAGNPPLPAEALDRRIDREVRRGPLARPEDGLDRLANALTQGNDVVHRNPPAPVDHRRLLRPRMDCCDAACGERVGDLVDEDLGIPEQEAHAGLVVVLGNRRIE